MTEELTLNVDGKVWGGWTDMTINRSLESVAGEFDLMGGTYYRKEFEKFF